MPKLFKTERRNVRTIVERYADEDYFYDVYDLYMYSYRDEHGVIDGTMWKGSPLSIPSGSYCLPSSYYCDISPEERIKVLKDAGEKPRWHLLDTNS